MLTEIAINSTPLLVFLFFVLIIYFAIKSSKYKKNNGRENY